MAQPRDQNRKEVTHDGARFVGAIIALVVVAALIGFQVRIEWLSNGSFFWAAGAAGLAQLAYRTFRKNRAMTIHAERISLSSQATRRCRSSGGATLVLMRHGESEGNRRNIFTGWLDLPLTDVGRTEAKSAAMLMKEADLVFDKAFASDLARAWESAEIVVDWLGGCVPLEASSALKERNYGALAGRDKDEVFREFGYDQVQRWRRSYAEPPPGGESLKDTLERVCPFFEREIGPLLSTGRNVLVVAHGSSLRALIVLIEERASRQIGEVEIATGEVLCYCVR